MVVHKNAIKSETQEGWKIIYSGHSSAVLRVTLRNEVKASKAAPRLFYGNEANTGPATMWPPAACLFKTLFSWRTSVCLFPAVNELQARCGTRLLAAIQPLYCKSGRSYALQATTQQTLKHRIWPRGKGGEG